MAPPRWIMHLDMDAFYASIEQRDDPALRGRPVVVGAQPGGRGVVATCSYEARRFGVRSAMPISEAYRLCPQAVYLRPDMPRYVRESRRIMEALHTVSPVVEPVSIDEAYLDVSGLERLIGTPQQIARAAKEAIHAATALTASVGIGPNRMIAKLASEHRKPDGVTVVAPEEVLDFLGPLPVGRLRGIGRRTVAELKRLGCETVADLRRRPWEVLSARFGAKGAQALYDQARGIGPDQVGMQGPRKGLSRETTFPEDVSDWGVLEGVLQELAAQVGRRARAEGLAGRVVTLKIRFAGFETHTRQQTLERPTHYDRDILQAALGLARWPAFQGRPVRLIGIGLSDWAEGPAQRDLFSPREDEARAAKLYETLDRVQARWGPGSLRLGMPKGRG
jgi:DNA polymerase IV